MQRTEKERMKRCSVFHPLKYIFIGVVFHNIFDSAGQDVAEFVDSIDFDILIVPQPVDL